jgi:hypothetical protein
MVEEKMNRNSMMIGDIGAGVAVAAFLATIVLSVNTVDEYLGGFCGYCCWPIRHARRMVNIWFPIVEVASVFGGFFALEFEVWPKVARTAALTSLLVGAFVFLLVHGAIRL